MIDPPGASNVRASEFSNQLAGAALRMHALAFALWWWFMPGGFSFDHPKFWSNGVIPLAAVLWVVLALWLARFTKYRLRVWTAVAFSGMWLASAVCLHYLFPITFAVLWIFPAMAGAIMGAIAYLDSRSTGIRLARGFAAALLGAVPGGVMAFAQHSAAPGTRPENEEMPVASPGITLEHPERLVQLGDGVEVTTGGGFIGCTHGSSHLSVSPLLTFWSRSSDACWTLFARNRDREGPERKLSKAVRRGSTVNLEYKDDGQTVLLVDAGKLPGSVEIDARSRVNGTVWSHLNTFVTLSVRGVGPLFASFSPCPDCRIAMRPMAAGSDRVAEFAYVDSGDVFHVAATTKAEKGPFREVASGRLAAGDVLAITFFQKDAPAFRVTLKDWASQASRQPSPTAGWGVPENAIELLSEGGDSAEVFITLAATSIGRGFDSVGHAAGVYTNRMLIEKLP